VYTLWFSNWKLAYPLSIKIKHLKHGFSNERLIVDEAKWNSKWIGKVMKRSTEMSRVRD
jgi:hypothetical protein